MLEAHAANEVSFEVAHGLRPQRAFSVGFGAFCGYQLLFVVVNR